MQHVSFVQTHCCQVWASLLLLVLSQKHVALQSFEVPALPQLFRPLSRRARTRLESVIDSCDSPASASSQHFYICITLHWPSSNWNAVHSEQVVDSVQVCNVLHHFLLAAFPEQYEARAEETKGRIDIPGHVHPMLNTGRCHRMNKVLHRWVALSQRQRQKKRLTLLMWQFQQQAAKTPGPRYTKLCLNGSAVHYSGIHLARAHGSGDRMPSCA